MENHQIIGQLALDYSSVCELQRAAESDGEEEYYALARRAIRHETERRVQVTQVADEDV